MKVNIKRLSENAVLPIKTTNGAAGRDLTCTRITQELNECGQLILVYHSDIAVEIPEGYVGLLFMRSSVANKSLSMCNAVGVIDSDYRGEITAKFRSTTDVVPAIYKPGERFAQLVIVPILSDYEWDETANLSETERGEGGYGSTGDVSAAKGPDLDIPSSNPEQVGSPAGEGQTSTQQAADPNGSEVVE